MRLNMNKFKVGDRVRVRQWDDMVKEYGVNEAGDIPINTSTLFRQRMKHLCGRTAQVQTINVYSLNLGNWDNTDGDMDWWFTEEMFEKVEGKKEEVKMENKMAEVAKLLGVEVGEEFDVEGVSYGPFKFTADGRFVDEDGDERRPLFYCLVRGGNKIKKRPWRPKAGEGYWSIFKPGNTIWHPWDYDSIDYALFKTGNAFRTKEEAEANAERISGEMKEFFAGE